MLKIDFQVGTRTVQQMRRVEVFGGLNHLQF